MCFLKYRKYIIIISKYRENNYFQELKYQISFLYIIDFYILYLTKNKIFILKIIIDYYFEQMLIKISKFIL